MNDLLTIPVAVILAGVWIILFGLGDTEEALDIGFGAAVAFLGFFNSGLFHR